MTQNNNMDAKDFFINLISTDANCPVDVYAHKYSRDNGNMFFTWNKLNRYEKDFIDSDTFDGDSDGVRAEGA
jgi:hypothetical protein